METRFLFAAVLYEIEKRIYWGFTFLIKDNEDGTWTTGKPNSERPLSTFKLNEEFDEKWGKVVTKNTCKIDGDVLVREISVAGTDKKIVFKVVPNPDGITMTHICNGVEATRVFNKV